jgi:hypothetical protein
MKRLSAILDPSGNALIGLNYSDVIDHEVLAPGAAETHAIPSGANYCLFSATAPFFAKIGGAAAVPAVDVTDGSGSMFNPELRALEGATTIGLIAVTACIVTMEFYC